MDNGLTPAEASEAITQVAFYAGWPRAMSAVPVLKGVFEKRGTETQTASAQTASQGASMDLQVTRANTNPAPGPADYFTGEVQVSANYKSAAPARVSGATVAFTAGARTAWHTHPLGQTLFIISGKGWVQKEGGPVETVGPGDVVWIPPHVKHWHGASSDEAMAHFAVAEAENGSVVTWMEKVSDEDYGQGGAID
jgi:4-carboxymuconolactone decarboxylase